MPTGPSSRGRPDLACRRRHHRGPGVPLGVEGWAGAARAPAGPLRRRHRQALRLPAPVSIPPPTPATACGPAWSPQPRSTARPCSRSKRCPATSRSTCCPATSGERL